MLTIDCPAVDVATAPSSSTCVSNYQKAVLSILDQLLAALEGVQLQGYVHRDIKLENVLLMAGAPPGQQVKVSKQTNVRAGNTMCVFTSYSFPLACTPSATAFPITYTT